jgi:hypothetical protein
LIEFPVLAGRRRIFLPIPVPHTGVSGPKLSMGARLEIIHGRSLVIVLSILIPSAGKCARIASAI